MTLTSESKMFGAGSAVLASVIPDGVMEPLSKLLLAAVIALVSGFCYAAGQYLWSKIKR